MKNKIKSIYEKIKSALKSKNDPDGSYTENGDKPTQDADDL